jgi:hypothetical protein
MSRLESIRQHFFSRQHEVHPCGAVHAPPAEGHPCLSLCWRLLTSPHGRRRHFLASKSVQEAFETVFDHRDGVIKAMIAIA